MKCSAESIVIADNFMKIAIIPARGGSKRIPGKNVKHFCGQAIINYSVDCALRSKLFDRIIVSTDCPEVAKVASAAGAEVPFMRPADLSDDFTPTVPVIRHTIEWVNQHYEKISHACCLYATAAFVQTKDLAQGLSILESDPRMEYAFSVTSFPFPIYRALKISSRKDGESDSHPSDTKQAATPVEMVWPEHELSRSQDLPETFHDAGQFYWGTAQAWLTKDRIFSAKSAGVLLPRHRVQDIDTLEDWRRAEAMYLALHSTKADD